MNSQSNGRKAYKVIPVGNVMAHLRQFHEEQMHQGKGPAFLDVLRQINERLRDDPLGFGEPLYQLPALKLLVHQGIMRPLVVTFGVHDELLVVFIRVVKLLAGNG
jgi:hypothetical protein